MGFKKEVKYGSVTIDFLTVCAKELGFNMQDPNAMKATLYTIGFQVQEEDEEGNIVPSRIDRMNNLNVRCVDKPYKYRKTTVFSGRLRDGFKYASIYDKVDILDISESSAIAEFVDSLPFEQPVTEKVNTRKYTKKEDRDDVVVLDLPQVESLEEYFAKLQIQEAV